MSPNHEPKIQASESSVRLGIWGTSGSGKTTYLTRLYRTLKNTGWSVEADKRASDFIRANTERMDRGEFPKRTVPVAGQPLEMYKYILTYDDENDSNADRIRVELDFVDAPGEFYERISNPEAKILDRKAQKQLSIIDYLLSCHGIIFLLDPTRTQDDGKSYLLLLENLFREMQLRQRQLRKEPDEKENKLEQYIAFAVTKVDRDDITDRDLDPINLVIKLLGPDIKLQWFQSFFWLDRGKLLRQINKGEYQPASQFHRCQFFSVSSVGIYQDEHGEWRSGAITTKEFEDSTTGNITGSEISKQTSLERFLNSEKAGNAANQEPTVSRSSSKFGGGTPPFQKQVTNQSVERIRQGIELMPLGVVEPLKWLIDGTQVYRPPILAASLLGVSSESS